MSERLWSVESLSEFIRMDDPEVRYWAVDRLIRHFPETCCDTIADLLLDDHDATPDAVARHLGKHGDRRHRAILVRGFRLLRGVTPGFCLQSLVRLGHPGVVELAAGALKRGELDERALAIIVESLGELGTPEGGSLLREYVARRPELLAEPPAMRGVLRVVQASELAEVFEKFLVALGRSGSHHGGEVFRTIMDTLRIDDTAWCFRTGPSGHIELRKTIKAVESGYDCDISGVIGKDKINQIAQRFRAGQYGEAVRAMADWTADAASRVRREEGDELPERIAAAVRAFTRQPLLDEVERLGGQVPQWLLGFELSAAFAMARAQNFDLALKRAQGDLDKLLELSAVETSFLLEELPAAIGSLCRDDQARARKAEDWCLRMLEAQGPFFPKVIALETLGRLGTVHFIPEMMGYLADENSYVYSAAERALSRIGEALIAPALNVIRSGSLDPEAAHSVLVLLCDLGTRSAYEAVTENLDWFMEVVGPGTASEWVSLFGTEELIDPLRDWLDQDPAMVGQGLLLLGAIHQVPIPEEDEILQAIEEDVRRRDDAERVDDDDGSTDGSDHDGGSYVM